MERVHDAGVAVAFKVLHCDGSPLVPVLEAKDVAIINGDSNEPFETEGGGASDLAPPANLKLYSVLMLDMSGSIFEYDAQDSVIDGAREFVHALVAPSKDDSPQLATIKQSHEVAIYIFSRDEPIPLTTGFTNDAKVLDDALSEATERTLKGSTNLYGAYQTALQKVEEPQPPPEVLVERFMVILTDGTHQAGNGEQLRAQALALRDASSDVHIFSVGIEAAFNEESVKELAPDGFVPVEDSDKIGEEFLGIAERVEAIARSNYTVVICTPVYLAPSTVILRVERGGFSDQATVPYDPLELNLNGDTQSCDAEKLMNRRTGGSINVCTNTCVVNSDCNDGPLTYGVQRACVAGACRAYCDADLDCITTPGVSPPPGGWVCAEYGGLRRCLAACNDDCTCTEDDLGCVEPTCLSTSECEAQVGVPGLSCL